MNMNNNNNMNMDNMNNDLNNIMNNNMNNNQNNHSNNIKINPNNINYQNINNNNININNNHNSNNIDYNSNRNNNNNNNIDNPKKMLVIFEKNGIPWEIQCNPKDKIGLIIYKYKNLSNDIISLTFKYGNKRLENGDLTLEELQIENNSYIKVGD